MKIVTRELTGAALDYAVAVSEGATRFRYDTIATHWMMLDGRDIAFAKGWAQTYQPSANWDQMGPIIERERIQSKYSVAEGSWMCTHDTGDKHTETTGPTPLIAAARCYVARVLGDRVDVPAGIAGPHKRLTEDARS